MNPLSPIQICNAALIYVGSGYSIDSFEEESPQARACRLQLPQSRREFLDADHPFSFATTRKTLAAISSMPNWYQLPTDMIKPVCLANDPRSKYFIERDRLYTENGVPTLIYILDDTDMAWMPPKAITAIQFILASKLAIILKQDATLARQMQQLSAQLISEVTLSDIKNLEMPDIPEYQPSLMGAR